MGDEFDKLLPVVHIAQDAVIVGFRRAVILRGRNTAAAAFGGASDVHRAVFALIEPEQHETSAVGVPLDRIIVCVVGEIMLFDARMVHAGV